MRNDDYGRIARVLADGNRRDVLEVNIANTWYPDGTTSYNVVAEIPGTDKKGEVVMLGGHLDSWHVATGATDNAIGCAQMMEAARILKALGVQPRRTIRVALWSGEEEGLLGSLAYVDKHFGTVENPKPEFATLDAYLNVDTGTGRIRGAGIFGPAEAATILRDALAPFKDLGVAGASASSSRATGGTDSTSFNHAPASPGIGFGTGLDRLQPAHPPHEPRYLRTHHRGRREGERHRHRRNAVSAGDARRHGAAVQQGQDAGAASGTRRTLGRARRIMPRLIEKPTVIDCVGTKPKQIQEFAGRVNSGHSAVSVARMISPSGWEEPGQRPEFEEITVVLKGTLRVQHEKGVLDVHAGQAVVTSAGEWVRYSTPGPEGAEYVAVCLPAFSPTTVHRDE